MERAIAAYREAARGDFRQVEPAIASLASSPSEGERAHALALRALFDTTVPGKLPPPSEDEIRAANGGPDTAIPLTLALHHRGLDAFIRFDSVALVVVEQLARELAATTGFGGFVAVAELSRLASAVLADQRPTDVDDASIRDAARRCDPALALHHEALVALALLGANQLDDALATARRASRMAASEGLLQGEYFANVTLARARRLRGRGHLAVRILTSLASVVPRPWQTWVGLECALAGVPERTPLGDAVAAAHGDDREEFRRRAYAVAERVAGFSALADELRTMVELIDPKVAPSARARAWVTGREATTPFGIRDPARSPMAVAYVVFGPDQPARRILTAGGALLPEQAVRMAPTATAIRTHHAVALIALAAPEGIEVSELFATVYGFPLEDPTHEEVFRGLLHRVRAALGDAADVHRVESRVVIEAHRMVIVPDPRCEIGLTDRILTFLAGSGGRATARAIADALHIPLRTVQRSLAELVDDGACAAEPDGRRVEYIVEDTTFHEPTLHRLRGRRD